MASGTPLAVAVNCTTKFAEEHRIARSDVGDEAAGGLVRDELSINPGIVFQQTQHYPLALNYKFGLAPGFLRGRCPCRSGRSALA
jgi:hypothetical protein